MIFVVDGYNVIHAVPELERKLDQSLKAARDALVALCSAIQSLRGDVQKILIIFDGDSAFRDLPQENFPGVEILFTESGEDADDRILDVLREQSPVERFCIVSNDNYVLNHARAFGVEKMTALSFQALAVPKKRTLHKPGAVEAGEELPGHVARKLTEDYKRYLGIDD